MKKILCLFLCLALCKVQPATAQQAMSIRSIMDSIQLSNPSLKMYDADVRSMDEAAKGAKSWMAPELSTGFFMVPTPLATGKQWMVSPVWGNML